MGVRLLASCRSSAPAPIAGATRSSGSRCSASGERIGIPTVALFELIYGYEKSARRERNEAALRSLLTLDVEPLPFISPMPSTPARFVRNLSAPARQLAITTC